MIFKDRLEAGKMLSIKLEKFKSQDPIVVALPRGGVEVGYIVAQRLKCLLEVVLSKKIS